MMTSKRYRQRAPDHAVPGSRRVAHKENFQQLPLQCKDSGSETNRWLRSDNRCASTRQKHLSSCRLFRESNRRVRSLRNLLPSGVFAADPPRWLRAVRCQKTQDPSDLFDPGKRLSAYTSFPEFQDLHRRRPVDPSGSLAHP